MKVSIVLTWGGVTWKNTYGGLCSAEVFFFLSGSYTGIHCIILQIYTLHLCFIHTTAVNIPPGTPLCERCTLST